MKNIIITISCIALLVQFSCKDESWNSISAQKNGESYNASISVAHNKPYDQGMDILIDENNSRNIEYDIFLYKIPIQEGIYHLDKESDVREIDSLVGGRMYLVLGQDVGVGSYKILEGTNEINELRITEVKGKEIKGTFDISFLKNSTHPDSVNEPDTVRFKGGEFEAKIRE